VRERVRENEVEGESNTYILLMCIYQTILQFKNFKQDITLLALKNAKYTHELTQKKRS